MVNQTYILAGFATIPRLLMMAFAMSAPVS